MIFICGAKIKKAASKLSGLAIAKRPHYVIFYFFLKFFYLALFVVKTR